MRRRRTAAAFLAAALILVVTACGGGGEGDGPDETPNEAIATPPPHVTAVLLRRVTYERGDEGQGVLTERTQAATDRGLQTTGETARLGTRAGEALLRPSDPQYRERLGYRAEWQSEFHAETDVEYWYGASYYLPDDWNQGDNDDVFEDRIIFQFHEGTEGSPAFSLHVREESGDLAVRRKRTDGTFAYLWAMPFDEERWYDFAFAVKWTREDDGFFRVYLDQELVGDYEGRTLTDGSGAYTKWGIYGQPTHVFFDEVRIVQGTEALRLASPASAVRLR